MLQKFKTYYKQNQLFDATDKVLLAVSGGKDSMAMLELFRLANLNFGVAHCNFQLRGEDAEADANFVSAYCKRCNIKYHSIAFDTAEYAATNKVSIQMAARDLRYNWFEKVRLENSYDYIATAHHQNDVAETILINLTNGTGLAGLHGIGQHIKNTIRPLLLFTRTEIDAYIDSNNIEFRQDKSNYDDKYTRNAIRLNVIPELEKINPKLVNSLNSTAKNLSDIELILNQKVTEEYAKCTTVVDDVIQFDIKQLNTLTPLSTYLYYFIKTFGFNGSDVEDIIQSLDEHSGKTFQSSSHKIVKDRTNLVLAKIQGIASEVIVNSVEELNDVLGLEAQLVDDTENIKIKKTPDFAYLDFFKIQFPLMFRKWKNGDVFQPFGMKGQKKLSDFFIDNKVDIVTKEKTWILTSEGKIVWVVGYRIDDNFKMTAASKQVLVLKTNN